MFGRSNRGFTHSRALRLRLGFVLCAAACQPAWATTEAEAVDELIAVLGESLPCQNYGVAWLANPPTRIEYRCATSSEEAAALGETAPPDRVWYIIDMVAARDRYFSVYRPRGTPTPLAVLAQLLSNMAALEHSTSREYPASPVMVYSRSVEALPSSVADIRLHRVPAAPPVMIFAR